MKVSLYFDGQFWVALIESLHQQQLVALRHVFGAEPQDEEVLSFIRADLFELLSNAKPGLVLDQPPQKNRVSNPKRLARLVAQELKQAPINQLGHLALQAQLSARKLEKKQTALCHKEAELQRRFELKRERARQKHRGH